MKLKCKSHVLRYVLGAMVSVAVLGSVHGGQAYAQDPAPQRSFRTSFDRGGDHIAACNLGILIVEDKDGLVEISWAGQLIQRFRTSFDGGGDGLACGDVDGDGTTEILVVEDKDGAIDLHSAVRGGLKIATLGAKNGLMSPSTYDKGGDGFAAGDVDGDGRAEVLVAEDKGGEVSIFDVFRPNETRVGAWVLQRSGSLRTTFDEGGDNLATCDLDRDGRAEILVAEDKGGKVEIYSLRYGKQLNPIWTNYDKGGDGLACGDVDGDGQPEILVAEDKGGEVTIYPYTTQ